MTDTELLLAVLRKLVIIDHSPMWFEPDLLYVDTSIYVTPEETEALTRFGVEPWTEIKDDE
jgi:hypothetical protein